MSSPAPPPPMDIPNPTEPSGTSLSSSPRRNAYLDVVRCVAIGLVVFHHYSGEPTAPQWLRALGARGFFGVDLFFVLSGWLLGGQLLRSFRGSATPDILAFFVRRWSRTLPAYYFVLGYLSLRGAVAAGAIPRYALFLQNYTDGSAGFGVSWSLCVEEHFYLILPWLLLTNRRWPRLFVPAVLGLLLASPLARWMLASTVEHATLNDLVATYYGKSHLRLDGLMLGVLCAWLHEQRHRLWRRLEAHASLLASAGVVLIGAVVTCNWTPRSAAGEDRGSFLLWVPSFLLVSLATASMLPYATKHAPRSPWWGPLTTWVAEHAYALYLVHYFGGGLARRALSRLGDHVSWFIWAPCAFASSLVLAWLLRRFIEAPGLRLRDWFARLRTAA